MISHARRGFLRQSGALFALAASGYTGSSALAAMGPSDKFDLVVKGGEVLDPART